MEQYSPGSTNNINQYSTSYYDPAATYRPPGEQQPPYVNNSTAAATVTTVVDHNNNFYKRPPPNSTFYGNNTASTPSYVEFSSTTYFNQPNGGGGGGNTFKDLYPNYKPSISTEETHGRYKPLGGGNSATPYNTATNSPPCQYQQQKVPENNNNYHVVTTTQYKEDIKPVYIQQHPQQQQQQPSFLQTIGSPPPLHLQNMVPASPHPNVPPNVLITTANVPTCTPNVVHSTVPNVTASSVMVTSSGPRGTHVLEHNPPAGGQPTSRVQMAPMTSQHMRTGYVPANAHHGIPSNEIPNVTIRSGGGGGGMVVHAEEPVVGMPVSAAGAYPLHVNHAHHIIGKVYTCTCNITRLYLFKNLARNSAFWGLGTGEMDPASLDRMAGFCMYIITNYCIPS